MPRRHLFCSCARLSVLDRSRLNMECHSATEDASYPLSRVRLRSPIYRSNRPAAFWSTRPPFIRE